MATEAESGHNYLAGPEKGGLPRERDDRCYFNSEFAVSFLDHALKIVLADVDDADLTFGILFGITRMSGVDHDRRAKLPADESRRRCGGVGRSEHIANLAHCLGPYRRYCWSVDSVSDLKLAPFHLLATDDGDKSHDWPMQTLARIAGGIIRARY